MKEDLLNIIKDQFKNNKHDQIRISIDVWGDKTEIVLKEDKSGQGDYECSEEQNARHNPIFNVLRHVIKRELRVLAQSDLPKFTALLMESMKSDLENDDIDLGRRKLTRSVVEFGEMLLNEINEDNGKDIQDESEEPKERKLH